MSRPIGIFDSGIGGLTVAHAIKELLPNEQLVYFGDTAHLPYGDKSEAAIQAYSIKITNILIEHDCKAIVIACNSASSAAYHLLKEYAGSKALVVNVIDPMVRYVAKHFNSSRVGLIGTKRTIESNVYAERLGKKAPDVQLSSLATPLLAHAIEEGFIHDSISKSLVREYLGHGHLDNIEALILGCTHYPLIKEEISEFYEGKVQILDSAEITAEEVKARLILEGLEADNQGEADKFMVSDFTSDFEHSTKLFFDEEVHLEEHRLWE